MRIRKGAHLHPKYGSPHLSLLLKSGSSEHNPLKVESRGQDGIPLMVKAAIAAEEEYKDTLYAGVDARAPAHTQNHTSMPERNHIDDHSFHGHVTSKPVLDGLLPVHPPSFLVLRECGQGRVILPLVVGHSSQAALTDKPATLRASTLMMRKYSELAMRPSTEVVISTNGACGAPDSSWAHGPLQRPHSRIRDRPAAVARRPERTQQGREPRGVLLSD